MAKVDLKELQKRVDAKLISIQKHPDAALFIYNYTPVAQFSRSWDEYTLMARGLILDNEGNIVARPFTKFFNYSEHDNPELPAIPTEEYRVFDKLDGSLGILYKVDGMPHLATRGSFSSDQALMGTKILQSRYADWFYNPNKTYLFEIIYPENRIVVDYSGMVDIILLAIVDTEAGETMPLNSVEYPFPVVKTYPMQPIDKLLAEQRVNAEGFVLQFIPSGMRVKIKYDDYVRLHRLLTQVSSKSIWELLKNGQDFAELIENVPDEFYSWVKQTADTLRIKHAQLLQKAHNRYNQLKGMDSRKLMAQEMQGDEPTTRSMVFALLDGKEAQAADIAWKSLKPKYEQPFKKDIDA